jgi:hypothetical protein
MLGSQMDQKNAADNSTLSWRNAAMFSSKLAKDSVVEPPI